MLQPCWAHVRFLIYCTYRAQVSTARPCRHLSPEGPDYSEAHASCRSHPSEDEFLEWVATQEAVCPTHTCKLRKCVYIHPHSGDIGGLSDVLHQNLIFQRKLDPPNWFADAVRGTMNRPNEDVSSELTQSRLRVTAADREELALATVAPFTGPALGP